MTKMIKSKARTMPCLRTLIRHEVRQGLLDVKDIFINASQARLLRSEVEHLRQNQANIVAADKSRTAIIDEIRSNVNVALMRMDEFKKDLRNPKKHPAKKHPAKKHPAKKHPAKKHPAKKRAK